MFATEASSAERSRAAGINRVYIEIHFQQVLRSPADMKSSWHGRRPLRWLEVLVRKLVVVGAASAVTAPVGGMRRSHRYGHLPSPHRRRPCAGPAVRPCGFVAQPVPASYGPPPWLGGNVRANQVHDDRESPPACASLPLLFTAGAPEPQAPGAGQPCSPGMLFAGLWPAGLGCSWAALLVSTFKRLRSSHRRWWARYPKVRHLGDGRRRCRLRPARASGGLVSTRGICRWRAPLPRPLWTRARSHTDVPTPLRRGAVAHVSE